MKERPILFKGEMVRAILEDRKTVTRRPVKDTGLYAIDADIHGQSTAARELLSLATRCPYGQPGDRLWVRETWCGPVVDNEEMEVKRGDGWAQFRKPEYCQYRASGGCNEYFDESRDETVARWRPSIHMPRWASRILLEVTAVRVERLQDISDKQAEAEGCYTNAEYGDLAGSCDDLWPCPACRGNQVHLAGSMGGVTEVDCNECRTAALRFKHLWVSINGADSWNANPWVWVVEFKRIEP